MIPPILWWTFCFMCCWPKRSLVHAYWLIIFFRGFCNFCKVSQNINYMVVGIIVRVTHLKINVMKWCQIAVSSTFPVLNWGRNVAFNSDAPIDNCSVEGWQALLTRAKNNWRQRCPYKIADVDFRHWWHPDMPSVRLNWLLQDPFLKVPSISSPGIWFPALTVFLSWRPQPFPGRVWSSEDPRSVS